MHERSGRENDVHATVAYRVHDCRVVVGSAVALCAVVHHVNDGQAGSEVCGHSRLRAGGGRAVWVECVNLGHATTSSIVKTPGAVRVTPGPSGPRGPVSPRSPFAPRGRVRWSSRARGVP